MSLVLYDRMKKVIGMRSVLLIAGSLFAHKLFAGGLMLIATTSAGTPNWSMGA
jgi:hypothetical protein